MAQPPDYSTARFSPRADLGLRLLALYILFVGPVVLASLAFDRYTSQRLEADVKASDLALARAIAQETNSAMDNALQSVQELARYEAVQEADPAGMEALFKNLMSARPDVNLVYRLDAGGMMLFHYPLGPGSTVGTDFSFRDYYQNALTTTEPLFSAGRISPTTGEPVATAVMPLWTSEGVFDGLVATNIRQTSLSTTLSSIAAEYRPEDQFQVMIVDSVGSIIAHSDPGLLGTDLSEHSPEVTATVLSGRSGNLTGLDDSGRELLYSYVPVQRPGWGVIVARPTDVAFATPRAFHNGVLIVIGVFLGIGLIFWIALSGQVIRPLELLAALSRSIGGDERLAREKQSALDELANRPDQVGYLVRSLTWMEQSIDDRLNELSTLLKTSAEVVSTLDHQTVLDRILEQVEHLLDVEKCAVVALDETTGRFRAQASRGLSKRYAEQISIDPDEPQSVTLRAIRTGEAIQVSDTEEDPTFTAMRPRGRAEGYRSMIAVPLTAQHAPAAALIVYKSEPHVFTQREINLLSSFANHAAMAIENAALYAHSDTRLQEQSRRLEALVQSLQDGLILEDLEGRVLYANRRISELVDLPWEEISGAQVEKLWERILVKAEDTHLNPREKTRQAVLHALEGDGTRQAEIAVEEENRLRYLRLHVFDVTDSHGLCLGRGQFLRDVTARREVDRMKSSLISTVSHELRTPLAAIKGYASTLLADDVEWDPLAQREFLEIISSETDRLSDLVNDLLDMSKIEAGNLTVSKVSSDLSELIHRAAQRAHPLPGDRLEVTLPDDLPGIFVDPQRIEVVLRNLIENATKYSGDDSPVRVSASVRSGELVVWVEDEGPGIPIEHSERIFDSFFRIQDGLVQEAPGAGIGLAICQGFVHAHGGEIWIEPRSRGVCVAFSLPFEPQLQRSAERVRDPS